MAGGKLPPRQKMIGLMYLVLLALLAMNVSKSILDSFVVINDGIEITTRTFDQSNAVIYSAFDKAAQESPALKVWSDKAEGVKVKANELYNHIETIKKKLYEVIDKKTASEADTVSLANIDAKDNYDAPTSLMGIADPASPTTSAECDFCSSTLLKEKLNTYQTDLLDLFEGDNRTAMEQSLMLLSTNEVQAHDGASPWEVGMFYHNPLAAVVTTLSKIQSDVRTAEAQVINKLYENIDAGGVSFNTVEGIAVLPKAYVLAGDSFAASIFTAAYDTRVIPEVYIYSTGNGGVDSAQLKSGVTDIDKLMKGTKGTKWGDGDWYQMDEKDVIAGKGKLKIKEGVGVHDWGGLIRIKTKKGPKVFDFKSSFEVGKPSLAVSADKMNVFYLGVDNPVSISAPMPKFKASAPGLTKKGEGWVMRPTKQGKTKIVVTGIDEEGKNVRLGEKEFRVKRIPDPKSTVGGKSGSASIKKAAFKAASTIQAKLEGFDFDIKVSVQSFTFSTTKAGVIQDEKVRGNKLNAKCKAMIGKAKRNSRFYIQDITVKMPDGTTRKLAPIILKVI